MIANSPVPMPKPPTANANSAQTLETAPTVFTSAIELIDATRVTNKAPGWVTCVAPPFPRIIGPFHLKSRDRGFQP
jgi:hypothetical protein